LVVRIPRRGELLGRLLIVVDGLLEQRIVGRVALLARLVLVVVAVAEEEVGGVQIGVGRDRFFVELSRFPVVLRLLGLIGRLERLLGLDLTDLGASSRQ